MRKRMQWPLLLAIACAASLSGCDRATKPDAVLATNTSSLSVTQIAESTQPNAAHHSLLVRYPFAPPPERPDEASD